MHDEIIRSEDIGGGWEAKRWSSGAIHLANAEKGEDIELNSDSASKLRRIFEAVDFWQAA